MTGIPRQDEDMATEKTTNPNDTAPTGDTTGEETEPVADQPEDDVNGIKGQIIYPDREVDAERAGEYAAGKVDTLYPEDEDEDRNTAGWTNPADRSGEVQDESEATENKTSSDSSSKTSARKSDE